MRKAFLTAYKTLFHCSGYKALKAWYSLTEAEKIAIIEKI